MLSIKQCRKILTQANPNRTWTDDEIERLRGSLYGIARLALTVLPDNQTHEVHNINKKAA